MGVLKIVKLTVWISLNINVNSAVQLHNGFAGEILISVNHVIRSSAVVIMYLENQEISYPNAQERSYAR